MATRHSDHLSDLWRWANLVLAVLFISLGGALMIVPARAANLFPWSVSPFVTMTIGAWYLSSGYVAFEVWNGHHWSRVHPGVIYLWFFSIGESILLLVHRSVLKPDVALFWPYMVALGASLIVTVIGLVEWLRHLPPMKMTGAPLPGWMRLGVIGFILLALVVSVPLLIGLSRGGTVWPGELTLLSARAFGVLYLAIALGGVPLLWAKGTGPLVTYTRMGLAFLVTITAAALQFLPAFDFQEKPGGLFYIGTYVVLLVGAAIILLLDRRQQTANM